mmetsp:Transcript_17953/g.46408  ORF Transcript_17953/g.46408 Transcript_17953/m.46408 type:complete len:246 (+) Transcript_17953:691-1428(+)
MRRPRTWPRCASGWTSCAPPPTARRSSCGRRCSCATPTPSPTLSACPPAAAALAITCLYSSATGGTNASPPRRWGAPRRARRCCTPPRSPGARWRWSSCSTRRSGRRGCASASATRNPRAPCSALKREAARPPRTVGRPRPAAASLAAAAAGAPGSADPRRPAAASSALAPAGPPHPAVACSAPTAVLSPRRQPCCPRGGCCCWTRAPTTRRACGTSWSTGAGCAQSARRCTPRPRPGTPRSSPC